MDPTSGGRAVGEGAYVSIITGLVTIITLWLQLRYGQKQTENLAKKAETVEQKLDHNTQLTKEGTKKAAENARIAADTASEAKTAAQELNERLNGGLEDKIKEIVQPIREDLAAHSRKDDASLEEIRANFQGLEKYVHQRNHDVLNALNVQSLKIDALLKKLEDGRK